MKYFLINNLRKKNGEKKMRVGQEKVVDAAAQKYGLLRAKRWRQDQPNEALKTKKF